jgi:hypothetical protein
MPRLIVKEVATAKDADTILQKLHELPPQQVASKHAETTCDKFKLAVASKKKKVKGRTVTPRCCHRQRSQHHTYASRKMAFKRHS